MEGRGKKGDFFKKILFGFNIFNGVERKKKYKIIRFFFS